MARFVKLDLIAVAPLEIASDDAIEIIAVPAPMLPIIVADAVSVDAIELVVDIVAESLADSCDK
ncbi:hypothetical protein WMF45_47880 [Sorangium sp. So ce448]|uniref:hypothetical protein n=1 Tax=Sorangium sp. So ce448 TaxID=3133314 RepID=UPI003F60172C